MKRRKLKLPKDPARSKISRRSKAKGSAFEREVCRRLSLWVSVGKRDDLFWRSAMSGGRASVRFKQGRKTDTQVGDISAIHPEGQVLLDKVVVECKHVRDLNLTSAMLKNAGFFWNVWADLLQLAAKVGREPMLIAKQNQCPPIMVVTRKYAESQRFPVASNQVFVGWKREALIYMLDDVVPSIP